MANTQPPFGRLLKYFRSALGLTQEDLAERAGLSARAISDLERGVIHTPHKDTVLLLANALHLTPQEHAHFEEAARGRSPMSGEAVAGGALLPGAPGPPLAGRRHEVHIIEQHLARVGPPLLLLVGEPGIGKTRLLREAAALAREAGWAVLEGGCSRRGGQAPYTPLLEALEGSVRSRSAKSLHADLEGCAWLVRVLPELAEQVPRSMPGSSLPPEQERRLVFAAIARYLTNIAGPAGTVVILDDLQWAGADALDLLLTLLQVHTASPLRVVGAYRDTDVRPQDPLFSLLADLARAGLVQQQHLDSLAPAEAAELISRLLASAPAVRKALAAHVLERAGGVPFFLVSCAQGIQSGALAARTGAGSIEIPWDLRQCLRQRVAALPQTAQELLGLAAIAGRVVPGTVLLAAAPWPEQEVLASLDAACQARLLVEQGEDFLFAHDLIREVVEGQVSSARRQVWHRKVARTLEQGRAGCPAEILAYHYKQAGELGTALTYLLQAVERAQREAAHREVVSLLAEAITLAEHTGQQLQALELRAQRGKACRTLARWAEAAAELEAVLNGLPSQQLERRAEVLATLAEVRHWLLDSTRVRSCATEALALAEQLGRDELAASALNALALADNTDGDLQTSLEHFQQAFARAGPTHLASLAFGEEVSGLTHYFLGNFHDAVAHNRQALEHARQSFDTTTSARALANLGLALGGLGRYDEALGFFAEAQKFAQEQETRQWLARALAMCGGLHLEVFDFAGAEALAEEAREIASSLNWPLPVVSGGIDLLLNFVRRGDVGRTEPLLDQVAQAVAAAQGTHGWLWRLRFAATKGEIALARGEWEEALRAADDTITQSQQRGRVKYHALGLEIRAKALAALGHQQEAITWLRQALALARPTGDPAMFLRAAAALLALEGDDTLLAEAQARAAASAAALPDEELRHRFLAAEPLRLLWRGGQPVRDTGRTPTER